MGCGATKERHRERPMIYDETASGRRSNRSSNSQLTARERLVYERPASEDGDVTEEPSKPVQFVSEGWKKLRAAVLDHVHSKKDKATRAEFDRQNDNFVASEKLTARVNFWMEEVKENGDPSGEISDDGSDLPKVDTSVGNYRVIQRDQDGVPIINSYLDRYLEEYNTVQDYDEDETASQMQNQSMMGGSMLSTIQSLSSQVSLASRGSSRSLRRSPQVRPVMKPALPKYETTTSEDLGECPSPNLGISHGDMGSKVSDANSNMDDVDALMFGSLREQSQSQSQGTDALRSPTGVGNDVKLPGVTSVPMNASDGSGGGVTEEEVAQ